jgi:predicted Rossmann fold nucleotide-binding protein DprA/Smf involved in DNA uptake
MLGALAAEGTAVGILSNELLRAATSSKYRNYLMANNLVLLSPFYPEAGFHAGNAMQRNKYIYCLSDAAIAVHSGTSGGTWTGVLENIRNSWVPMWIKPTDDPDAGNETLVQKGARWLPENVGSIDLSLLLNYVDPASSQDVDLFAEADLESSTDAVSDVPESEGESALAEGNTDEHQSVSISEPTEPPVQLEEREPSAIENHTQEMSRLSLYEHFVLLVEREAQSPKTVEELMEVTELHKTQLNEWLKKAVADRVVTKHTKPVRYEWAQSSQRQMFEEK